MNLQEKNRMIAEFMGATLHSKKYPSDGYWFDLRLPMFDGSDSQEWADLSDGKIRIPTNMLLYNSSWDWLIPVIDKITSHDSYPKYVDHTSSMVAEGGIYINTRFIRNTYDNVVDFITWHNKNA